MQLALLEHPPCGCWGHRFQANFLRVVARVERQLMPGACRTWAQQHGEQQRRPGGKPARCPAQARWHREVRKAAHEGRAKRAWPLGRGIAAGGPGKEAETSTLLPRIRA